MIVVAVLRYQFYDDCLWTRGLTQLLPRINLESIYSWVFEELMEYNGFLVEC